MTEDNFYLVGRAILEDHPEVFYKLRQLVQEKESQVLADIDQLPALYNHFCALVGDISYLIKEGRQVVPVINHRRLFIAIATYLYDPLFFNNYSGRMRDRLRSTMADTLQCFPVWISATMPSVKFEYMHLAPFQMQVHLIGYYLKQGLTVQAA